MDALAKTVSSAELFNADRLGAAATIAASQQAYDDANALRAVQAATPNPKSPIPLILGIVAVVAAAVWVAFKLD